METIWGHALFLALSTAISAAVEACTLKPIGPDQGIKVFYTTSTVPSGCVSRGPTEAEIHVLQLKYSNPMEVRSIFNVSVAKGAGGCSRKAVFILSSNSTFPLTVQMDDCPISFITNKPTVILPDSNVTKMDLPGSTEQLLEWAKRTYGGISSFALLENPQHVHFQIGRGLSTPEDCIPESKFKADEYLEVKVASSEVKSCLRPSGPLRNVTHVLWLEQGPRDSVTQAVDVNMQTACRGEQQALPELLVLKGQPGILWHINQMSGYVQFWASGDHYVHKMFATSLPGMVLPDSIKGLIEMIGSANRSIASFTRIPSAKSITLQQLKCEIQVDPVPVEVMSTPTTTQRPNMVVRLVTMLKPWSCTDHGLEVVFIKTNLQVLQPAITEITLDDPSCKARDNNTHFVLSSTFDSCKTHLEGGIHAKNQLILTQRASPDKVTVPFQCDLPEKLRLQLYRSPDFSPMSSTATVKVDKVTYVQASLRTAEKAPLMPYNCLLQPASAAPPQHLIRDSVALTHVEIFPISAPKTSRFSFTYTGKGDISTAVLFCKMYLVSEHKEIRYFNSSLEVKIENLSSPPHNQGLGIGAVLGITFGAFLIGVLLTAALWYIYSHTRPTAKTQPASATLPASESSSTNHSIGSTQSTPCSTSSMA